MTVGGGGTVGGTGSGAAVPPRTPAMACICTAFRVESELMADTELMPAWIRATVAPVLAELASGP